MFDHILVPLDGSQLAECVLPHAVALARTFGARVTLLQAVERARGGGLTRAIDPLRWQIRKSEAGAYLDEIGARLQEAGLQADKALLEGSAAERIVEYAQTNDVSLIILSSHGWSGPSKWNINSVVQKIIIQAYMPVLIVRAYRPATGDLTGLRYKRLLLPLDGSQRAEVILPLAITLARSHGCLLVLAHVVSKPELPRRTPRSAEENELVNRLTELNQAHGAGYLEQLRSRLAMDVETRLLSSENIAATLHELVAREEIDMVMLSAHGYSGEAQWPYGSVALNFIAYCTAPLLIMQDISRNEVERTQAEIEARGSKGH